MTPTPAIIDVTTVGPTSSTIFSLRPSSDGMRTKTPPQKTVLRRSRREDAIFPVTAIVSAWNETVATESKAKEPAAPTRNASAVGKAAKPSESARSPCGTPFSTTATASTTPTIQVGMPSASWKALLMALDWTMLPVKPRAKMIASAKKPARILPKVPLNACRM